MHLFLLNTLPSHLEESSCTLFLQVGVCISHHFYTNKAELKSVVAKEAALEEDRSSGYPLPCNITPSLKGFLAVFPLTFHLYWAGHDVTITPAGLEQFVVECFALVMHLGILKMERGK